MANLRFSGTASLTFGVVLLIVLALFSGCAGRGAADPPLPVPTAGPVRVSAQWLRRQPGRMSAEFTFHRLDSQGLPLADWTCLGLDTSRGTTTRDFSLAANASMPDDLYLYVTYPAESFALDEVRLAPERSAEYLLLAIPHRLRDVLVIGVVRTGAQRGQPVHPGPLLEMAFTAGHERCYRTVSQVNQDPRSAPVLAVAGGGVDSVQLGWEERNIGDYNNNGLVEVADLTPVGRHYEQQVAGAEYPARVAVVDGNLDGYITVADLTPIGSNFGRRIEGYSVYSAVGDAPQPAAFTPVGGAQVLRQPVYDATPLEQQRQRLNYSLTVPAVTGLNHYYVRAFSTDGPALTEGVASNTVEYTGAQDNQPPIWVGSTGLTGAAGIGDGLDMNFGPALDPEGGPVEYVLRYSPGELVLGAPETVVVVVPAGNVSGDPPYSYRLDGLERGTTYSLLLRARDEQLLETDNLEIIRARVPAPDVSADTWPYHRYDPARTGCNPGFTGTEPFTVDWSATLDNGGAFDELSRPVISAAGWIAARDRLGAVQVFDLADGAQLSTHPAVWPDETGQLALDGTTLVVAADSGLAVYDLAATAAPTVHEFGRQAAPLLLGDYIYTAGADGTVRCLQAATGTEEWSHTPVPAQSWSLALAADDTHLYIISDSGHAEKLDLLAGGVAAAGELGSGITGGAFALDILNGRLYFSRSAIWLTEVDTADFTVLRTWEDELPEDPGRSAPALLLGHNPPLAFVADDLNGLYAADLVTGGMAWLAGETPHTPQPPYRVEVTCGQSRVFVSSRLSPPRCYDLNGNLRGTLPANGAAQSAVSLGALQVATQAGGRLQVLGPAAADGPPVWDGTNGVRALVAGDGRVQVQWDQAIDDHGEPVYYVIYYRAAYPPELGGPHPDTALITGIRHTGPEHSYWVDGLENGTRYYFTVRAYDGIWDDSPNVDSNTGVLGITPPWQREEMLLGSDLPPGEIYFMRGLAAPDGSLHLVYNDITDTHLTHLWGTLTNGQPGTAVWAHEGPGLAAYTSIAFEPAWDSSAGRLVLGWATAGDIGTLTRTGGDTWDAVIFPDTTPGINPHVSLQAGTETALAYTEHILLGPVENHIDYYLKRTVAGLWQPYEPLEETNLSGRDIDLVLDPGDGASPWVAYQRGGESTPNRHTPQEGECGFAWWNAGTSAWSYDIVDAGVNAPASDCGKRVQQVLDPGGRPHLAYLDLNAAADEPAGQLKYAFHDGSQWQLETVDSLDLSFQTADLQFTYGELGLSWLENQPAGWQPAIATLQRTTGSTTGQPHLAILMIVRRTGADEWVLEQLTDEEWVFPRDREPCVMLRTADAGTGSEYLSVFFATTADPAVPAAADMLVHYWREYRP